MNFREEGEIGLKSREEGEIGSESRKKGDLPPCSTPLSTIGRAVGDRLSDGDNDLVKDNEAGRRKMYP